MQSQEMNNELLEKETMQRIFLRLVPFLMLCYLFAFINRGNIGMAALQMNHDLRLSPAMFGFASSLFFIAYFLFEIPSNLMLQRFGARKWLSRIMITWGLVSMSTAFVKSPESLYVMRFLLGAAEAGFFPGVILYLSQWFPSAYRARVIAMFMVAIPVSTFLSAPISAFLLQMDGVAGLRGWHWLFLCEGMPSLLLGCACLFVLSDQPHQAGWLTPIQSKWLMLRLAEERRMRMMDKHVRLRELLCTPLFWCLALICSGASAAGTILNIWQPQILKSLGLSLMQIAILNAAPYAVASVAMVWWSQHSDRMLERRWHTKLPLFLIAGGLLIALPMLSLGYVFIGLSITLIGSYSFKGPFWAMTTGLLSEHSAVVGIAGINAVSNLIGGGLIVNLTGWIKQESGSYMLALVPITCLSLFSTAILLYIGKSSGFIVSCKVLPDKKN